MSIDVRATPEVDGQVRVSAVAAHDIPCLLRAPHDVALVLAVWHAQRGGGLGAPLRRL